MMRAFAGALSLAYADAAPHFVFDGQPLKPTDTPQSLELEDEDLIYFKQ
jgi:hypothetical protein